MTNTTTINPPVVADDPDLDSLPKAVIHGLLTERRDNCARQLLDVLLNQQNVKIQLQGKQAEEQLQTLRQQESAMRKVIAYLNGQIEATKHA